MMSVAYMTTRKHGDDQMDVHSLVKWPCPTSHRRHRHSREAEWAVEMVLVAEVRGSWPRGVNMRELSLLLMGKK